MLNEVVNWSGSHIEHIALGITVLTILWQIYQYLKLKKSESKQKEFENFHKLIGELVGENGHIPYVDRQTAIVYEFRRLTSYRFVLLRILKHLDSKWSSSNNYDDILKAEIMMTIEFLESNPLKRLLTKLLEKQ